jgi:hypothetical protein
VRETTQDAKAYLDGVALGGEWTEIYELNGAALFRVGDDHFVILACSEHEGHNGHELLLRVLPPHWVCFHQAFSPEYGFEAFHYGPDA